MKKMDPARIRDVVQFVSRFGFITREIYFAHFCKRQRTQQYESWNYLLSEKWLIPHDSKNLTAYLSTKARSYFAPYSVPASPPKYIEHDSVAAQVLLSIEAIGIVHQYWTEPELAAVPQEVFGILGAKFADKIPDLMMDLSAPYGVLRVAFEAELTGKSKERYDQAALSYLAMRNVDLVIYGCRYERTAVQVLNSFQGEIFLKVQKLPAIFMIDDFAKRGLEATLKFQSREFKIHEFLSKALRREIHLSNEPFRTDSNRTAVRPRPVGERKSA